MRIIAQSNLKAFWEKHPDSRVPLERWISVVEASAWTSASDVQGSFSKAKVLNGDRVRFDVSGGDYRLIVGFKFQNQIAFIKFVGTHADYDRIDALTVSQF